MMIKKSCLLLTSMLFFAPSSAWMTTTTNVPQSSSAWRKRTTTSTPTTTTTTPLLLPQVKTLSSTTRLFSAPPKKKKKKQEDSSAAEYISSTDSGDQQLQDMERALVKMLEETEHPDDTTAGRAIMETTTAKSSGEEDDENAKYVMTVTSGVNNLYKDPALQIVSSEIGIKQLIGEQSDDAAVATAILLERTLDTFEDIMVHIRRIPYDKGFVDMPREMCQSRKTVVVLGSGWAAHALMKVADCCKIRLIVVSPSNHFVFTPMLASAAVGTVEYRSMTEAVRDANPMIDQYVEGKATDVDVYNKKVTVQLNTLLKGVEEGDPPTIDIDYDHLIVAVGNQVSYANVPGAAQRCLRLKSCDDARRLRTAVGEAFEYASRPNVDDEERSRRVTFCIIGGGPTGVELAGELSDFAQDITRAHVGAYPKLRDHVKVILIHGGNELLPQFEPELRSDALRALERRGIEARLNTRVTQVENGSVTLSTKVLDENGEPTGERKESTMPMGLSVWCAGIAPVPFVDTLLSNLPDSARGQGGRINVDRWLRPPMPSPELTGSIMVLGDAASLQSRKKSFLPQTAQVAGQQGAYVARLLVRGYNLTAEFPVLPISEMEDNVDSSNNNATANADPAMAAWLKFRNIEIAPGFEFLNLGLLAYIGGGKALSQVQIGDVPVFSYAGSVAFILWRSVYLVKQVATRNRVLVTFDWIKSFLFGRDTTRL